MTTLEYGPVKAEERYEYESKEFEWTVKYSNTTDILFVERDGKHEWGIYAPAAMAVGKMISDWYRSETNEKSEISSLKAQLAIAEEALEFYAQGVDEPQIFPSIKPPGWTADEALKKIRGQE